MAKDTEYRSPRIGTIVKAPTAKPVKTVSPIETMVPGKEKSAGSGVVVPKKKGSKTKK